MSRHKKHHREHNKDFGREHRGIEKSNINVSAAKIAPKVKYHNDQDHIEYTGHKHDLNKKKDVKLDDIEKMATDIINMHEGEWDYDNFASEGAPIMPKLNIRNQKVKAGPKSKK